MTFPILLEALRKEDPEVLEYFARGAGFEGLDDFMAATEKDGFGAADVPLVIRAYRATVGEGRRVGMSESELAEYVYAPAGPMTRVAYERFKRNLGIKTAWPTQRRVTANGRPLLNG